MSNYNEPNEDKQKNVAPHINWFIKDSSGLKRGGTAPIMNSRRNRPTLGTNLVDALGEQDQPTRTIYNSRTNANIPQSQKEGSQNEIGSQQSLQSLDGEDTRITKIQSRTGVSTYRLTLKKSNEDNSGRLPNDNTGIYNRPPSGSNATTSTQRPDTRNQSLFSQIENMLEEPADLTANMANLEIPKNIGARPGSSHVKGGPGFRRNRILNESVQNHEEFQTPNTGNLDLESLNGLEPEMDADELRRHNLESNDLRLIQNASTESKNRPWSRQGLQSRGETDNTPFPKYSKMARMLQKGSMKDNQIVVQNFKDEGIYERNNSSRGKNSGEANPFRVKQMFESRKFVEDDIQTLNVSDGDDDHKHNENMMFKKHGRDHEKPNEAFKENLVGMIGRSVQDNSYNKRPDEREHNYFGIDNKAGFALDDGDSDGNIAPHRQQVERPPARKNHNAMNLDDRYSFQQSDKKPTTNTSINQSQLLANNRPPSRHKIPSKALGLDLPTNDRGQEHEVENNPKRDMNMRKSNNLQAADAGYPFEPKEHENMNFNKVLDFSDFLEGEDNQSARQMNTSLRPSSSNINQRRSIQTAQGLRQPQMEHSARQIGPSSSKNRTIMTQGTVFNPSANTKTDLFGNLRNSKSSYKEIKPEKQHYLAQNGYKSNGQNNNQDVDDGDVFNMDHSDSDESDIFSQRHNASNVSNSMSRVNTSSKLRDSNKPKNNFLTQGPGTHKDKKSEIVFVYNKEAPKIKKENVDMPFETTLGKDFLGLFAN